MEEFEEREIHLRDYFQVLKKRKLLILSVLVLVFLVAAIKTFTSTKLYTAASQVLVERNFGNKELDYKYYGYEPDFLNTQAAIIMSPNVAEKVVDNLQLADRYRHYFIKENVEISFLSALKNSLRSMVTTVLSAIIPEKEDSRVTVSDSQSQAVPSAIPKTEKEIIARMIRGGLRVIPIKDTKTVAISYSSTEPAITALIANAVVEAYVQEMLEIKLSTSSYSVQWMTDKAGDEREKLEHSERSMQQFMRDNDLVTVENRLAVLPQKLAEFGTQLSKAEAEKKELRDLLIQIRAADGNLDRLEVIPNLASSEVLKIIRERIYKANQTIQELSKKYGTKHPRMVKANDELNILKEEKRYEIERILSSISNSYELAASKEKSLQELLAETKAEMLGLNEKFMQYKIMEREVSSNRVMYETLQAGIKKESVTEHSQNVNIWVIHKAETPSYPSKPDKRRNLMLGLILGLAGGVGLAFFIEYLDNTVKTVRDLEDTHGLTVLGSIAYLNGKDKSEIDSVVTTKSQSPTAESYRLIRSNLLLSTPEKPPKVLLFTSMNAKEGKTTTTANVARILAQGGSKVLVIDCDMRKPRLHTILNVKNTLGLSSYLSGSTSKDIMKTSPVEGVHIITSGPIPPTPVELLISDKMKKLVQSIREKFDFVLLDSPPIQSVTDSLQLCHLVDGTIVVVRSGKTTNETLESGMKKLQDVHAKILGFILNGVKSSEMSDYYHGYIANYGQDDSDDVGGQNILGLSTEKFGLGKKARLRKSEG